VHHQVLQRIFEVVLILMVEVLGRIWVDNHLNLLQQPMELDGGTHAGTPRSSPSGVDSRTVYKQQAAFKKRKKEVPGRVHQPMPCLVRGTTDVSASGVRCMYKNSRGLELKSKKRVSYKTIYQCEECTAE
jgi:hypothetical protein